MATAPPLDRKAEAEKRIERYLELEALAGTPTIDLSSIPEEAREEAKQILGELEQIIQANPLEAFKPHEANDRGERPQLVYLAADTAKVAAFCGNQFGKSTVLMVKSLIQVLNKEDVPEHLQPFKVIDAPCHGWILCPTEDKIFDSLLPVIDKWCPRHALKGGNRSKAFNGERMMLTFANGSTIAFKTYKQDPATLGGATLHFIGFDEPPPRAHRDEAATRLLMHGPREWYAMTPLKSNTGWIRREVWRKRESPDITVVKGSVHDNPKLNREGVELLMASYKNDLWRRAREFGDFMDIAGQVYAQMSHRVVKKPTREFVHGLERVVGIDPGIRNAAFIFGGFDGQGVDWIWDEELVQDGTPSQYAEAIDRVLDRWGLQRRHVQFVIDPAARQRSQATGDTVQSELTRVGIYTQNGVRDRETGQQQIRDRLRHERLWISEECRGLLDEADEFAWEMDDEDEIGAADDSPYHRLATLRYQVMTRPFYPVSEEQAAGRNLGWQPGKALRGDELKMPPQYAPLGPMS